MYNSGFWNDDSCELPFQAICSDVRGEDFTGDVWIMSLSFTQRKGERNRCTLHFQKGMVEFFEADFTCAI